MPRFEYDEQYGLIKAVAVATPVASTVELVGVWVEGSKPDCVRLRFRSDGNADANFWSPDVSEQASASEARPNTRSFAVSAPRGRAYLRLGEEPKL